MAAAALSRRRNTSIGGAKVSIAMAVIGPTPGIVCRRRARGALGPIAACVTQPIARLGFAWANRRVNSHPPPKPKSLIYRAI